MNLFITNVFQYNIDKVFMWVELHALANLSYFIMHTEGL